jgi:hypothetical protein
MCPLWSAGSAARFYLTAQVSQLIDTVIQQNPQPKRYHQVPVFSLPEFSV